MVNLLLKAQNLVRLAKLEHSTTSIHANQVLQGVASSVHGVEVEVSDTIAVKDMQGGCALLPMNACKGNNCQA